MTNLPAAIEQMSQLLIIVPLAAVVIAVFVTAAVHIMTDL